MSQFALWRRRLIADQALEKVLSIIRVRQYELKALVEEAMASPKREGSFTPELRLRLERAEQLVEESTTAADSGTTQKDRTSYKTERGERRLAGTGDGLGSSRHSSRRFTVRRPPPDHYDPEGQNVLAARG